MEGDFTDQFISKYARRLSRKTLLGERGAETHDREGRRGRESVSVFS